MAEWINQTFEVFSCEGDREPRRAFRVGLEQTAVTFESGEPGNPESFLCFIPKTQREASQLSMVFRKTAKRFEEIGKGLQ